MNSSIQPNSFIESTTWRSQQDSNLRGKIPSDFHGLSDIPTVFQEHIDKVLEFKTPVWLDDIICVTNGTIEEHERELREVLTKLQEAGYRASERKTEMFKKELTWLGYLINQNGVKPIQDKTDAITKLKAPTNAKELKSFLGSIQHLSKFLNNLSKKLIECENYSRKTSNGNGQKR